MIIGIFPDFSRWMWQLAEQFPPAKKHVGCAPDSRSPYSQHPISPVTGIKPVLGMWHHVVQSTHQNPHLGGQRVEFESGLSSASSEGYFYMYTLPQMDIQCEPDGILLLNNASTCITVQAAKTNRRSFYKHSRERMAKTKTNGTSLKLQVSVVCRCWVRFIFISLFSPYKSTG